MAPNGARRIFPTNPDLADILGRTDLDFENFYVWGILGDLKSPDFQVPDFKISRNLAWAHLGPLGRGAASVYFTTNWSVSRQTGVFHDWARSSKSIALENR